MSRGSPVAQATAGAGPRQVAASTCSPPEALEAERLVCVLRRRGRGLASSRATTAAPQGALRARLRLVRLVGDGRRPARASAAASPSRPYPVRTWPPCASWAASPHRSRRRRRAVRDSGRRGSTSRTTPAVPSRRPPSSERSGRPSARSPSPSPGRSSSPGAPRRARASSRLSFDGEPPLGRRSRTRTGGLPGLHHRDAGRRDHTVALGRASGVVDELRRRPRLAYGRPPGASQLTTARRRRAACPRPAVENDRLIAAGRAAAACNHDRAEASPVSRPHRVGLPASHRPRLRGARARRADRTPRRQGGLTSSQTVSMLAT